MSIIRTEVSGYHHIGFYDTEFIIKGTLYIDTRKYSFLHYDGAFGFSRLEIEAGKVKASYDEAEGFQMQQGKEAPEGGLLNANRKDAIKQIQEAAISYLTTDLNAWAEYFNLATRSAGPFAYTLTQCIAFPTEKYRCTITPASPYCELIYNFGFDEECPKVKSPLFPGEELFDTKIDLDFIEGPARWLYSILLLDDEEHELPLNKDYSRIVSLEMALDCKLTFEGFQDDEQMGQRKNLILFSDVMREKKQREFDSAYQREKENLESRKP